MVVRRVLKRGGRVALSAVVFCAICSLEAAQARPNVLLITLDTVRADHLGCYGGKAKTPALDALAHAGVLFERAYATVPLTLPSHASILTGTYPLYNGVRGQPGFRLPDDIPTIAERFKAVGYATAAILGSSILDRRFGLAHGFSDYDDHIANVKEEEYAGLPAAKRTAEEVVDLGWRWLERERARDAARTGDAARAGDAARTRDNAGSPPPFFLWLHFYDAHLPYRMPRAQRARFSATYDGEIAYIDSTLAALFENLRALHLYDTTLIAVVSDHGEGLGDHGESTHGLFIYDSTIRVPLIIKPVGEAPAASSGTRSPELVSTVDIAPTLLRLADLAVPGSMQGSARTAAVTGRGHDTAAPVYVETFFPLLSLGWNPLRALIAGERKFIQAPRPELYDLARDAGELRNQMTSDRALAGSMLADLNDFVRRRTPAQAHSSRMAVSQETAQLFASLGYVGGAGAEAPVFTTDRRDPKDGAHEAQSILDAIHVYERNDLTTAERMLRVVLRTDPDEPLALDTLGSIQFKRHQLQAARATYTHLLQAAPYYSNGYTELAHTDALLGQRAQAERLYQQAFAADPSNGRALRDLGLLLVEDGKLEEAQEILEKSLQLQPNDFFALNGLGEIHVQHGNFAAAADVLEKAVAADPRLVPPRLNLGFVYLRLNHPENTARLMEETTRLAPRNAQAFAELAVARIELGDPAGAERATHLALQLDPTNGMAREAQRALSGNQAAPH